MVTDANALLTEEAVHTDAFDEEIPGVEAALDQLAAEFSTSLVDQAVLAEALKKGVVRRQLKARRHEEAACHSLHSFSCQPAHSTF